MVLGDRVSERTVEQFRAAGQQQGFVDISGRRRMRSEVDAGDQDEELEQPIVRARTAPAASSETPQLEQRSLVTGIDVGRTVSPSSQRPNQQLHWKTHGCDGTQMEHQILESDLLDI